MNAHVIELILEGRDKSATRQIKPVRREVGGLEGDVQKLSGTLIRVATGLGIAFGSREVLTYLDGVTRRTQMLTARLTTLEGSELAGAAIFGDIAQLAADMPFQVDTINDAYIRLRNTGLQPTAEQLLAFGEIAAGNGKDLVQWAEAVADAQVGEFERLKEFGIKVNAEGTKLQVRFRGQTREISRDGQAMIDLLTEIGQTEFAGGMERQMRTLDGIFSNTKDGLDTIVRIVMESGLEEWYVGRAEDVRDFVMAIAENRDGIYQWAQITITSFELVGSVITFQVGNMVTAFELLIIAQDGAANIVDSWTDRHQRVANVVLDAISKTQGSVERALHIGDGEGFETRFETGEAGSTLANIRALAQGWADAIARGPVAAIGEHIERLQHLYDLFNNPPKAPEAPSGGLANNSGKIDGAGNWNRGLLGAGLSDRDVQFRDNFWSPHAAVAGHLAGVIPEKGSRDLIMQDYLDQLERARERSLAIVEGMRDDIAFGLVDTALMVGEALAGGLGSYMDAMHALWAGISGILGDIMINAGTMIVTTSTAFDAMKTALLSLVPGGGIAAGLLLIAAGSALKAATSGFLNAGGSAGGGASGRGSFTDYKSVQAPREERGELTVVLPDSGIINTRDVRQRKAFVDLLKMLHGTGELNLVGG